jgi:AcrR family transcriptional regulator
MASDTASTVRSDVGETTYDRILAAATSLFIEKGFAGTPVSQVAKNAGVTTPALYWHFGSKEELYFTAVKRVYVGYRDELLARAVGHSSEERLGAYVHAFVEMQLRDPEISTEFGYQQLRDALQDDKRAELDAVEASWVDHLKQILLDGREEGVFTFRDLNLTAMALISMCEYVFTWFKPDGRLATRDVADLYTKFASRLVGAELKPPCGDEQDPT